MWERATKHSGIGGRLTHTTPYVKSAAAAIHGRDVFPSIKPGDPELTSRAKRFEFSNVLSGTLAIQVANSAEGAVINFL